MYVFGDNIFVLRLSKITSKQYLLKYKDWKLSYVCLSYKI